MKWKCCELIKEKKVAEDILHNPIYEQIVVKTTRCRETPWTNNDINLDKREVTKNEQYFAIPIPFESFPDCSYVRIDGVVLEINQKIDLSPRWTVIKVKALKK